MPKSRKRSDQKTPPPFGTIIEELAHRNQVPAAQAAAESRTDTASSSRQPTTPPPAPTETTANQKLRALQAELEKLQIEEFQQKLDLRATWSRFLMGMVVLMIFFQMGLFLLVGLELLTFQDEWIARLVLPGTFAQILGFVYIIITFLFPTPDKAPATDQPAPPQAE